MKIVFSDLPMKKELHCFKYKVDGNATIEYDGETIFPVNSVLAKTMKKGEKVKVVLLSKVDIEGNSAINAGKFQKELNDINRSIGADIEYTGRFQLDGASLDRFAVIEIDYSPAIENALADGDTALLDFVRTFRKVTYKAGIKCIASYRTIERIKKMKDLFNLKEVLKMSLTKGLRTDDLNIIKKGFADEGVNNEYVKALI